MVLMVSLLAQSVKNIPAMQKTWVPSLGQEEPLRSNPASLVTQMVKNLPAMQETQV